MLMREFVPLLLSVEGRARFIVVEIDGDDAFIVSNGVDGLGNKPFRVMIK